ncbi:DUF397 domain-containing protein [Streptomyces sp. NPDC052114]|uniref:DUF397 domain-containing protein n=1 Tax=unclassified Streptomyces TaxID=2593676 RepID=UPI00341E7F60
MGSSWTWRKSSASDGADDNCVQVAWTGEKVRVRDSARPRDSVVDFGPKAWSAFLALAAPPAGGRRP